jgi:hypothetical protein
MLLELKWNGQRSSKQSRYVVRVDGGRQARTRCSATSSDRRLSPSMYLIGLITMLSNRQAQRLGDLWGTLWSRRTAGQTRRPGAVGLAAGAPRRGAIWRRNACGPSVPSSLRTARFESAPVPEVARSMCVACDQPATPSSSMRSPGRQVSASGRSPGQACHNNCAQDWLHSQCRGQARRFPCNRWPARIVEGDSVTWGAGELWI